MELSGIKIPLQNLLKFLEKTLDKLQFMCYNQDTKRERKIPNTRKEKLMFDNSFIIPGTMDIDFFVVTPDGQLLKWEEI